MIVSTSTTLKWSIGTETFLFAIHLISTYTILLKKLSAAVNLTLSYIYQC